MKAFNKLRIWLENAPVDSISSEDVAAKSLCQEFADLCEPGLGKVRCYQAHIYIKLNARFRYFKPRPVLFAMNEKIETDFARVLKRCNRACSDTWVWRYSDCSGSKAKQSSSNLWRFLSYRQYVRRFSTLSIDSSWKTASCTCRWQNLLESWSRRRIPATRSRPGITKIPCAFYA